VFCRAGQSALILPRLDEASQEIFERHAPDLFFEFVKRFTLDRHLRDDSGRPEATERCVKEIWIRLGSDVHNLGRVVGKDHRQRFDVAGYVFEVETRSMGCRGYGTGDRLIGDGAERGECEVVRICELVKVV
jgi:hypothetical protein